MLGTAIPAAAGSVSASRPGSHSPGLGAASLRILLAEDNVVNQQVARMQLAKFGFNPVIVSNGRAAVATAQAQEFDVVLMDCQMPELDGLEATRQIRHWEAQLRAEGRRKKNLQIIAMTANAMQGDREACLAAGMDDYISKPVQLAALQTALVRATKAGENAPAQS